MNAKELAEQILHTYSAAYDDKKIRALAVALNKIWQKACEAQNKSTRLAIEEIRRQGQDYFISPFPSRKHIPFIIGSRPKFNIDSL